MNKKIFQVLLLMCVIFSKGNNAKAFEIPVYDDIDYILIEPQKNKEYEFYTVDSFLEALPLLRRANFKAIGFGKVWKWQKGVVYLKNGNKLRWRAFTKNIILFENEIGQVFYTDIISQTHNTESNKITRQLYSPDGSKEIEIYLE